MKWFDFPVTAAVTCIAVLATALFLGGVPLDAVLAEREAIFGGELWRLVTGPFVHVTWGHLVRDVVVVAVIGVGYERPLRPIVVPLTIVSLAIPCLAVLLAHPQLEGYFGLSGMSHSWIAAALAYEISVRRGRRLILPIVVAVSFAAKIGYEQTGGPSFVPTSLGGVATPAPFSHVAGAIAAVVLVAVWTSWKWSQRPNQRGDRALGTL